MCTVCTTCTRKWKEKNESVSFQPSATTSARDEECSSNGSNPINKKCFKCVTLNIISTLVMLLLLEATVLYSKEEE
jgi:hypothetical protein